MPLWLPEPLVLASRSAVRHAILREAGIPLEVEPADIDERALEAASVIRDALGVAGVLARAAAPRGGRPPRRARRGRRQALGPRRGAFPQPRRSRRSARAA